MANNPPRYPPGYAYQRGTGSSIDPVNLSSSRSSSFDDNPEKVQNTPNQQAVFQQHQPQPPPPPTSQAPHLPTIMGVPEFRTSEELMQFMRTQVDVQRMKEIKKTLGDQVRIYKDEIDAIQYRNFSLGDSDRQKHNECRNAAIRLDKFWKLLKSGFEQAQSERNLRNLQGVPQPPRNAVPAFMGGTLGQRSAPTPIAPPRSNAETLSHGGVPPRPHGYTDAQYSQYIRQHQYRAIQLQQQQLKEIQEVQRKRQQAAMIKQQQEQQAKLYSQYGMQQPVSVTENMGAYMQGTPHQYQYGGASAMSQYQTVNPYARHGATAGYMQPIRTSYDVVYSPDQCRLLAECGVKTPTLFWLRIKRDSEWWGNSGDGNGGFDLFDQGHRSKGIRNHVPLQKVFREYAKEKNLVRPRLDSDENRWEYSVQMHNHVIGYLQSHPHKNVMPIITQPINPKMLSRLESIRLNAIDMSGHATDEEMKEMNVPSQIAKSLAPFQKSAVKFCIKKKAVAFIADEMGLGKTLQSIAVMSAFTDDWPLLVICPSAARFHWQSEFLNWLGTKSRQDHLSVDSDDSDEDSDEVVDDFVETSSRRVTSKSTPLVGENAAIAYADDDDSDSTVEAEVVDSSDEEDLDFGERNGGRKGSISKGDSKGGSKSQKGGVRSSYFPLSIQDTHVISSGNDVFHHKHKVVIASYQLFSNFVKKGHIKPGQFKCVIVDESHMIKSRTTQRTKALLPVCLGAKRRLLLSGTPALSKPEELYTQIRCVTEREESDLALGPDDEHSDDVFVNFKKFKSRYCKHKSGSHKEELYASLAHVMIRRLKKDMLKNLPPKRRRHINVTLEDEELARTIASNMIKLREVSTGRMNEIANDLEMKRQEKLAAKGLKEISFKKAMELMSQHIFSLGLQKSDANEVVPASQRDAWERQIRENKCQASFLQGYTVAPETIEEAVMEDEGDEEVDSAKLKKRVLMKLFMDTGLAKVPAVVRHVQHFIKEEGGKLLIFAHHKEVLNRIEALCLKKADCGYIRIDGSTLPQKRQQCVDNFQSNNKVRVALLGITAAGVALTLTAASSVMFAELFWTPAFLLQAEDRCHRIGQQSVVKIKYFIAKNSLDDVMWELTRKKFKMLGEIIEGKKNMRIKAKGICNGGAGSPSKSDMKRKEKKKKKKKKRKGGPQQPRSAKEYLRLELARMKNKGEKDPKKKVSIDDDELEEKWSELDKEEKAKYKKKEDKAKKTYEKKLKEYEEKKKGDGKDEESEDSDEVSSSSSSEDDDEEELEDGKELGWGDDIFQLPSSASEVAVESAEGEQDVEEILTGTNQEIIEIAKREMEEATKGLDKEESEAILLSASNEDAAGEVAIGYYAVGEASGGVEKKVEKTELNIGRAKVFNVDDDDEVGENGDDDEKTPLKEEAKPKMMTENRGGMRAKLTSSKMTPSKSAKHGSSGLGAGKTLKRPVNDFQSIAEPKEELVEIIEHITEAKLGYSVKFTLNGWCRITHVKNLASPALVNDVVFSINGMPLKEEGVKSVANLKTWLINTRVSGDEMLPIAVCLVRSGGKESISETLLDLHLGKVREERKAKDNKKRKVNGCGILGNVGGSSNDSAIDLTMDSEDE